GQDESSTFMFGYVDRISALLVEEFGTERERLVRSAEQLRAETVRTILAEDPGDTEAAARGPGDELRGHHLAIGVSSGGNGGGGRGGAVEEAGAALDGGEPLVIASGAARFDVWCGAFEPLSTEALEQYEPPAHIRLAYGRCGQGVTGFRSSHHEA